MSIKKKIGSSLEVLSAISIKGSLILAIVGLVLGTVFSFGMWYWDEMVDRDEAVSSTAKFEEYEVHSELKNGSTKWIEVRFSDRDPIEIYTTFVSDEFEEAFKDLYIGEEVHIIQHPETGEVLDMRTDEVVLLDFDEVKTDSLIENAGFTVLAIFAYASGGVGILTFIYCLVKRSKNKKENNAQA